MTMLVPFFVTYTVVGFSLSLSVYVVVVGTVSFLVTYTSNGGVSKNVISI